MYTIKSEKRKQAKEITYKDEREICGKVVVEWSKELYRFVR